MVMVFIGALICPTKQKFSGARAKKQEVETKCACHGEKIRMLNLDYLC